MNLSKEQTTKIVELMRGIADVLESANTENTEKVAPAKEVAKKEVSKNVEKAPVKEEVVEEVADSREAELTAMAFNDLKKYAKEIGVSAVGTKAQIIAKVLEAEASEDNAEAEIVEAEESNVVVEEENADVEEETLADKVARELKDSTDAELKEILSDVGIKAVGKRQALLDKIVKAIEDGKLDFGDDEEDTADADADTEEGSEDAEEIPGSEERLDAMETLYTDLKEKYENKEITDKEIADFLKEYYGGKAPKGTKEDKLEEYLGIQISLIDDEGEQHDLVDPYYVGDDVYCCGAPTKELENGHMYCEVCGNEYEV